MLSYYDELTDEQKRVLIEQIGRTDFGVIRQAAEAAGRGRIAPIKAMTIHEIDMGRESFEHIGMEAIRSGKVGAVLLAGGMGTRLGSDAPKGMYENFNQAEFLKKVAECPKCPKSACPSPERFREAYHTEAEHVYVITLSSHLSGSYNSAVLGMNLAGGMPIPRESASRGVPQTLFPLRSVSG